MEIFPSVLGNPAGSALLPFFKVVVVVVTFLAAPAQAQLVQVEVPEALPLVGAWGLVVQVLVATQGQEGTLHLLHRQAAVEGEVEITP